MKKMLILLFLASCSTQSLKTNSDISSLNFELDLLFPEQEITPKDIGVNNNK